jgi:hypothetical protein
MTLRQTVFLALVGALGVSGCASITQGTSQTLIFSVEPKSARCTLTREGDGELGSISATRNTVTVSKDKDDIVVACRAEGYEDKTMRIVSTAQAAGIVGGAFLDLGITDLITGAMWKYPGEVTVVMDPAKPGTAAQRAGGGVAATVGK